MLHQTQKDDGLAINRDLNHDRGSVRSSIGVFASASWSQTTRSHRSRMLTSKGLVLLIFLHFFSFTMRAETATPPILTDDFESPDPLSSYQVFGFGKVTASSTFVHAGKQALQFKTNGKGWGCVAMRSLPAETELTPQHALSYWVYAPGVYFPDATLAVKVIFANGSEWALREEHQLPISETGSGWTPLQVFLEKDNFQWESGTVPEKQGIFALDQLTQFGIVFYSGRHVLEIYVDDLTVQRIASGVAPPVSSATAPPLPTVPAESPAPVTTPEPEKTLPPANLTFPPSVTEVPIKTLPPPAPIPPDAVPASPPAPVSEGSPPVDPVLPSSSAAPISPPPPERAVAPAAIIPPAVASAPPKVLASLPPTSVPDLLIIKRPAFKTPASIPAYTGLIDDFSPPEQYNNDHRNDVIIPGQRTGGITDVHCLIIEQTAKNRVHTDGILALAWSRPNMCWFTTLSRTGVDISNNQFLVVRLRCRNPEARITVALDSTGSGEGEPWELPPSSLRPEFTTINIPLAHLGSPSDLRRVNALTFSFLDDEGVLEIDQIGLSECRHPDKITLNLPHGDIVDSGQNLFIEVSLFDDLGEPLDDFSKKIEFTVTGGHLIPSYITNFKDGRATGLFKIFGDGSQELIAKDPLTEVRDTPP